MGSVAVGCSTSHLFRGMGLFKHRHRADSGACGAAARNKHQMLKYISRLITFRAANITRIGTQLSSNIPAVAPATVPKNLEIVASSGTIRMDDETVVNVNTTCEVIIDIKPFSCEDHAGTAATKISPCVIQSSNDSTAIHSSHIPNDLAVTDYAEEMYQFYKVHEQNDRPLDYIHNQMDISEEIRASVVNCVVAVHYRFGLRPETLYLAINLMDRYLSVQRVQRRQLKLVGISALYISSKYEEIEHPEVEDFVDMTEAYMREEVLAMEKDILTSLQWRLTVPTQYMFLLRCLQAAMCDKEMERMVYFFSELGLMQYSMVKYPPSIAAASAVYAARVTLKERPFWTETLENCTGLTEKDVLDCARILVKCHADAPKSELKVVYAKYSIAFPQKENYSFVNGAVALLQPALALLHEPIA